MYIKMFQMHTKMNKCVLKKLDIKNIYLKNVNHVF